MKRSSSLFFLLFICGISYAQNLPTPSGIMVFQKPVNPIVLDDDALDELDDITDLFDSSTQINYEVSVNLSDTLHVNKIHVKLGTTEGGNDIGEHTYTYDDLSDSTYTYSREEYALLLGVGQHGYQPNIYCEVYVEDSNGLISAVAKYNN